MANTEEQQQKLEEPVENQKPIEPDNSQPKSRENVKFSKDDTFTSEDGGDEPNDEHVMEAKKKATPANCKRRQATRHLVIQSPTDHIFSPCSQKLLHNKKRTEPVAENVDEF